MSDAKFEHTPGFVLALLAVSDNLRPSNSCLYVDRVYEDVRGNGGWVCSLEFIFDADEEHSLPVIEDSVEVLVFSCVDALRLLRLVRLERCEYHPDVLDLHLTDRGRALVERLGLDVEFALQFDWAHVRKELRRRAK